MKEKGTILKDGTILHFIANGGDNTVLSEYEGLYFFNGQEWLLLKSGGDTFDNFSNPIWANKIFDNPPDFSDGHPPVHYILGDEGCTVYYKTSPHFQTGYFKINLCELKSLGPS